LLPKDLINVTGDKWRVLPVHMGSKGYTGSGVLRNSTVPLSRASIPVVFLSTYNIDYILVQESLISKVTKVLEDHSIINNIILEDYVCSALIPPNNKLIVKPYSLHLASINRENMRLCAKELVRLMFYPPENQKFFHFTETEDEVSLLLDSVSYSIIPQELLVTSDTWKQILRYKKNGLYEVGVVNTLARPIADKYVTMLYLSTFSSTIILVQDKSLTIALEALKNASFDVCEETASVQ